MDLETARRHIQTAFDRMRAAYQGSVFDEWAILGLAAKGSGVLAYQGPRAEAFRKNVPADSAPLRKIAAGRQFAEGDIEFVPDAADTHYDAFMKIGSASYLVLNHTSKTLDELRGDEKWLKVQAILFELSEKFRSDALAAE